MRRALITAAAVALALAVPVGTADAQAPPDLPDLAQMAVAPADLPHGATVASEGYTTFAPFDAVYYRAFAFSRRAARHTGVGALANDLWLSHTPDAATKLYTGFGQLYRNTKTGRTYVRSLLTISGLQVRRVRIGAQHELGLAGGAFAVRATATTRRGRVSVGFGVLVYDRVVTQVITIGRPRGVRMMRTTRAALRATGDRVQSTLTSGN